jgi:hypothetical protein
MTVLPELTQTSILVPEEDSDTHRSSRKEEKEFVKEPSGKLF